MYSFPLTTAPPTSCVGCGYGAKFCQCPSGYCADASAVAATIATAEMNHFIECLHSPVARAFKARATGDWLTSLRNGSRRGRLHFALHLLRELTERHDRAPVRWREPLDVQPEFFYPRIECGVIRADESRRRIVGTRHAEVVEAGGNHQQLLLRRVGHQQVARVAVVRVSRLRRPLA